MITSCGALSMRSAALPLDNCNGAEEDASINGINGHSGYSSNKSIQSNSNSNNNNSSSNNNNSFSGNSNKHYGYTVINANSISWTKSNQSTNPALRNINNDMTKGIPRKAHQCKMQFTASDRDANKGQGGGDDLRMTKIMRRLHNETSPAAALELCAKLEMAVRTPTNMGYLTRSFDVILEGMLTLFKQCPLPVLEECSKTLGLIGYINGMSYPIYEDFIIKNYRANKRMQKYLISALRTTLSCDTKCDLHIYAEKILLMLKDFLESAENADNFMVISSCIVQFSRSYRDVFERHFTDVVDIIIGWQLEKGQPKELRSHCAYVLEQLTPYFSKQLDFSYGLLTQFVEDITAEAEHTHERIGAFVGAFNALLKCLTRMHITCESIVSLALGHLIKMLPKLLLQQDSADDNVLININELLCICLLNGYTGPDANTLAHVLQLQFEKVHLLHEPQQLSCLYLLLCTVRKLRARLPASLVQLIFQGQPFLAEIRLHNQGKAHNLLLRTCQETLLIKNVPLLQQAYKQLVQDIEECVQQLANLDVEQQEQTNTLLLFHLAALAALAKQTSSIIGMYACKPSILELLLNSCRAQELSLWSRHAATHYAILGLLVVHCQANHNFRNNSSLLRDADQEQVAATHCGSSSPTAHSFGQILKFLAECLAKASQLAPLNLKLLLKWTHSLLAECSESSARLLQHEDFHRICEYCASMTAKYAPLESAACIQTVLGYDLTHLGHELLQLYRETALQQLQMLNGAAHAAYAQIHAKLPLHLSVVRRTVGPTGIAAWLQRLTLCSGVRDNVFRDFLERLQQTGEQQQKGDIADCLRGLFMRSCQQSALDERQEKLSQCTRRCHRLAASWLQFEAARYCVDQKLRTTLGKPQDTFLAFEAIVMRYARLLSGCAKSDERQQQDEMSLQQLTQTREHLNMLLGFLDSLEKLIYNAAEGSAFALHAPEKPVAAFFRLNNPTCQSWFNRIRIAVVIIAMHCQQPELVIRYAQQILLTQKVQDTGYSQAIVYLAWAYIRCREADSLRGLQVWARSKCECKSYQWLQHAADQAAGRKELALAGYRKLLDEQEQEGTITEPWEQLEPHTRQFVIAQMNDCLQSTGQWTQLVVLKRSEDANSFNPFLQQSNGQLSDLEKLLAKHEAQSEELTAALHKLSLWPNEQVQEHASCSATYVHKKLENIVLQQVLHENAAAGPVAEFPKEALQLLDSNWRECLLNPSCDQRQWQQLTLLQHIAHRLGSRQKDQKASTVSLLPICSINGNSNDICSTLLLRCVAWTQLLQHHCSVDNLKKLYLDTAMVAREEGNPLTCQAMLEQYFGQPLQQLARQLLNQKLDTTNAQLLRGYSELSKCLHLQQQQQQQLQCSELSSINVCAALCLAIQKKQSPGTSCSIGSELLLTLSDWITARNCSGMATNLSPPLQQLLDQLPECALTRSTAQPMALPHGERLVARLINASLQQRPNNEEALIAYGNWCYRWGKKIVDSGCVLTQSDVTAIGKALGGQLPLDGETLQELLQALRMEQQTGNNCCEEGDELQAAADAAQCEVRLRRLSVLANKPASVLEEIMRIWRKAIANTFDYYKEAARSYFQYLSIKGTGAGVNGGSCVGIVGCMQQQRFQVDDNNMVTTTLRLLRLIVKHASGLQEVLEQGLKTTPIGPWKVIIPQLFSRLNHHEIYVRKSVCALLCRLAESRPQLVTFPAVVGANRELQVTPISSKGEKGNNNNAVSTIAEDNCYGCLLGALSKQSPAVVQHVQLLVKELRRVCLLWDEYWIHSLAHIYNSYVGRVNALSSEFKPDDHEGKQTRFNSWRPQLLSDLEALMAFTSREPETSYERSFKKRFDGPIKSTLEAMRLRPYPEAWDKLKQLYHVLQANMLRGTSNTLKMQSISPVLCNIGRMSISMPGLDAQDELQPVHIKSVESSVCILPTKTKPKKVAFYGSNGQKYTFLFKGLEDLHLDERIMQFLSISNAIMASKSDTPHSCYRAHHYSVIPLGPQSGLISWVDGVTPLFALYKKWQQRQPQAATSASSRRLTDLYFNKLSPLLAKHNMLVTDPRRQWPLSTLRQVLNELIQETPADLLARELWCQAASAAEWRHSVRRYTMCMSVMSVIGYVIGLGDRHLDNVLINLSSGDLVHIDYNVCFEKGRTLRIPERVPFRLTQNMVHALGISGVEGAFRLGCEYVLKVMRKERETLLTLLEAFVYDPLVDWTVNDDATALRRGINAKPSACTVNAGGEIKCKKDKSKTKMHDWEAKRRHLIGKLKQCQKFWTNYKQEMMPQLTDMVRELEQLQQTQKQRQSTEQELVNLNQRSALIAEINSLGTAIESHSFNTASPRYASKRRHTEALARQAQLRQPDYELVQCLLDSYGQCLDQQHLGEFNGRLIQLKLEGNSWHSEYMALVDVLQSHLPPQTLEAYNNTRSQLDELFGRLNDLALQCLEHMVQYAAIMYYYPEQCKRDNIYVRFHASYSNYKQHAENPSSSSSSSLGTSATAAFDKAGKLNAAQTLDSVWMDLNCHLHQLTQHFANEQALAQTQPPSHSLLAAIQQSQCNQILLNVVLIRTLDGVTDIFGDYEMSALEAQDVKLLQQQLQFLQLIRAMCQGLLQLDSVPEQANEQLCELQDALTALVQLQHCFEYEVPATIFRLLLLAPNLEQLQALLQLGSETLSKRFHQHKDEQQQQGTAAAPAVAPPAAVPVQQQFLLSLQTAYALFKQLSKALERIARTIKLGRDDVQDAQNQQYMELNILKNIRSPLSDCLFFELVLQTLRAGQSYDVRQMARPVLGFVQRLEAEYLVGLVPLVSYVYYTACGTHCQAEASVVSASVVDCPISPQDVSHMCDELFSTLQMEAQLQQQQCEIALLNQQLETLTLIASAHYWAYDALLGDTNLPCGHVISRSRLCNLIHDNWQTLDENTAAMQRLQRQLETQLKQLQGQRSNWNRNHIDSLLRNEQLQRKLTSDQLELVHDLSKCASALCTMEQAGCIAGDQNMLHNLEQWLQAHSQWQASNARISGVEQAIVQLLDPEGAIDHCWLENVQGLLEDYTCKVQRDIATLECEQQSRHRNICSLLKEMQRQQEHMPRIYMRSLVQEQLDPCQSKLIPLDVQLLCGHVRESQRMLLNFFQRLLDLRKELSAERRPLLPDTQSNWQQQVQQIQKMATHDVDEFFRNVEEFLHHSADSDSLPYETFAHNKGAPNQHEQKRNAYGVSVWKKIRMKLEGRDPDNNQRSTVAEQVDYVIREATNPDNLAVLYEGWTPWV